MRVIVVGAGRLGTQFAAVLTGAGNEVTLVDQDPAVLAAVTGTALVGDGCEPTVLEEAGAHAADMLVAATGQDDDNLVGSLLAQRQVGGARAVAPINHPRNTRLFD